jgi:hypothetical protein
VVRVVVCVIQLSCAGKDWTELPRDVAESYGKKTTRLDLCYNDINTCV